MTTTMTLTDASFDEVVKSATVPVLVDLWAEWCGPCKMVAPVLDQIAAERAGRIQIAKLNIDENMEIARRYNVMSIPTLLLFVNGELRHRIVGALPKAALESQIDAHLG